MSTPGAPLYAPKATLSRSLVRCSWDSFTVSKLPTSAGRKQLPFLRFTWDMGYSVDGDFPSASFVREFILSFSSTGVLVFVDFLVVLSTVSLISISTVPVGARDPFYVLPIVFPSVIRFT